MICDIANGSVNRSSSACYHIHKSGYIVCDTWNSIAMTQRTLWNSQAMPYVRDTSISIFRVCWYNKVNQFNEGNLVFADEVHLIGFSCSFSEYIPVLYVDMLGDFEIACSIDI